MSDSTNPASNSSPGLDPLTVLVVFASITGALVVYDFSAKLSSYLFGYGSDLTATCSVAGHTLTVSFKTRNGVPPELTDPASKATSTDALVGLVTRTLGDCKVGFSGMLIETP